MKYNRVFKQFKREKKQRSKYYNSERRSTSVHKHVKYAATRPYELQICIKNPFVQSYSAKKKRHDWRFKIIPSFNKLKLSDQRYSSSAILVYKTS